MLLKGVNKRVIVIKNPESEIFEEAYFIVKNKSIFNKAKENEMVLEANRIISDYSKQQKISAGEKKNNKSDKKDIINDEDFFDDAKFFVGNNFGDSVRPDSLKTLPYMSVPQSSAFKFISSKRIFKLPRFQVPPKSFFIGVGVMSAIIISIRILELIFSR